MVPFRRNKTPLCILTCPDLSRSDGSCAARVALLSFHFLKRADAPLPNIMELAQLPQHVEKISPHILPNTSLGNARKWSSAQWSRLMFFVTGITLFAACHAMYEPVCASLTTRLVFIEFPIYLACPFVLRNELAYSLS